jgi:hypothetical protein
MPMNFEGKPSKSAKNRDNTITITSFTASRNARRDKEITDLTYRLRISLIQMMLIIIASISNQAQANTAN